MANNLETWQTRSRVAETVGRERTGWQEKRCGLSEQLFSGEPMYFAVDLEELRRKKKLFS